MQLEATVTSHAPASTLAIGFQDRKLAVPWVADLGDPVLAAYTHWRWRSRARMLERKVWREADAITVTAEATGDLMEQRHGPPLGPCVTVPQGYDAGVGSAGNPLSGLFDPGRLELLYTGSFYRFRRPEALAEAVLATPGVRLSIASMQVPASIRSLAARHPGQLRLLGFVRHADALLLQRAADVLVNIANRDPAQVPGKFHEYLGSGRPILHLGESVGDHAAGLLRRAGAGWVCENDGPAVASALLALSEEWRSGRLGTALVRDEAALQRYRWDNIARTYANLLAEVAERARGALRANT